MRAAIVLACGRASRFGSNKLLALLHGEALITHALHAAQAAPVERIVLVARAGLPIPDDERLVTVPGGDTLPASLRAGLAAAADCEAAFVFLGDMPLVPHGLASELAARIGDALAAVPEVDGQPGHPVLLTARAFALAAQLQGDEGLGKLLRGRGDVLRLPVSDMGAVLDVDTPAALAAIAPPP